MGIYDRQAQNVLAKIKKKGGRVTFHTTSGDVDWWALGTDSDPDKFAALNLVLNNPQSLMIPAWTIPVVPVPGMFFTFGSTKYRMVLVNPAQPASEPIYYDATGNA